MKPQFLPHVLVLAVSLVTMPASLAAQTERSVLRPGTIIAVEVLKPDWREADVTFASSATILSARVPTRGGVSFVADLPFAHLQERGGGAGSSNATVGNPYVGLALDVGRSPVVIDAGLRFPFVKDDAAAAIHALADMDRMEAFASSLLSAHVGTTVRLADRPGQAAWATLGASGWFPSEGDHDRELLLNYGLHGSATVGIVDLNGALSGRMLATERDLSFGESSLHQASFGAGVRLGRVQPNFTFRIPLDEEVRDLTRYTIGLGIRIRPRVM